MKKFVGPQIAQIFADSEMLKVLETDPKDRFTRLISTNPNLRESAQSADHPALAHARILSRTMIAFAVLVGPAVVARAGNPPVVSNVTSSQRTDGSLIVDVYYDLADVDGGPSKIALEVSDNAGGTWDVPAVNVNGDVGNIVIPGTAKHIVWDSGADIPNVAGAQYQTRICADDLTPPGMRFIPAGEYLMGNHAMGGGSDEYPQHAVYIDAFYMDRYEVTNQQYADALNWAFSHGGLIAVTSNVVHKFGDTNLAYCDTNPTSSFSRITWTGSTFGVVAGKANHPMELVSWYGAAAYSNWRSEMQGLQPNYDTTTWICNFPASGYRLPTEAEWEKAARGGLYSPYHVYPQGDAITGANANYSGSNDPYEALADPDTTPVGYYDGNQTPFGSDMANGYGLYDMAGNVWEWCNDWHGSSYYSTSPYSNPSGPGSGLNRVLRGGAWNESVFNLRCAKRTFGHAPGSPSFYNVGFRLSLD